MLGMKKKDRGSAGRVLLDWRERRDYTQEELARKSGVDVSSIGAYERGERKPKGEKLARICVALGMEADTFFDEVAQAEADALKPLMDKVRREMGEETPSAAQDPDLEPYSQAWDLCSGVWKDMFLLAARVSRGGEPKGPGALDSIVRFITKINQISPLDLSETEPSSQD